MDKAERSARTLAGLECVCLDMVEAANAFARLGSSMVQLDSFLTCAALDQIEADEEKGTCNEHRFFG